MGGLTRKGKRTLASSVVAGVAAMALGTLGIASGQEKPATNEAPPDKVQQARDRCGGPDAKMRHKRHFGRLVHAEAKIQTKEGFGSMVTDTGKVTSIDAPTITIKRADNETVKATGSDQTRVCKDGNPASLSDIEVGDLVRLVQGNKDEDSKMQLRRVGARSPAAAESSSSAESEQADS